MIEASFGIDLSNPGNDLIDVIQARCPDVLDATKDSVESFLQDISRGLSNNTVYDNPLEVYKTKKLLLKFKKFKDEILGNSGKNDSLIKNPCYYVLRGNDLLSNKQNKEAIEEFKKAVELDPYFQVHAYYNMGYARIAEYGNARKEDYDREIPKAVEDLRKARTIIEDNLEPMLNLIQQASTSKALSEQVQHKMALYAAQKSAIEQAVGIGSNGMRTKRIAEDHQLNLRINQLKINQKLSELRLAGHPEQKIKDEITAFEMALPEVTEGERQKLRTKDIKDAVRTQKITVEETKINKELTEAKETVKKYEALSEVEKLNYKLPVLPLGGILSKYAYSVKTEAETKKEAFNNFKNGATATADQQRFYEEFERNVKPTSKEISDKRAEMQKQDDLLENGIIGQAIKNNNGVKIELVDIKKSLPEDQDVSLYNDEISEFRGNGFYGTFQVTEIKPIPWWSVIGMGLLALGQMIGGAALTVFTLGAGSSIGMGLITEGVSDLITAVKDGIINRSLDWASWAIQKAISLTVSIVCAGLGAIKDAAKTAIAGVKAAAGAVKTAALGGKVIIEQTVKNGWKLAAKAVGVSIAKGVAKEVVTQLVDYGISKALMPSIEEEVRKRVEGPIQEALTNEMTSLGQIVKKMLELDGKNRNNYYQSLIKRKAMEILNPQNNPEHALLTITKGIAKGIASNKIPGLSTVLQIGEAVAALDELSTFVPKFIDNLTQEMTNVSQQEEIDKKYSELIQSNPTHKKQTNATSDATDSKTGIEERKEEKKSLVSDRQHVSAPTIPSTLGDVDLNKGEEEQTQVELTDIVKSPDKLRTTISGSISANMCSIIQGKLIGPLAHAGVNFGIQKLTAGIDQNLQNELGNYQAERRVQFMQSGDKGDRVPEEHKKGWQSEEAKQQAMEKASKMIEGLQNGEEAGLPHLGALSDKTGRPIAVDDGHPTLDAKIAANQKQQEKLSQKKALPTFDEEVNSWDANKPGNLEMLRAIASKEGTTLQVEQYEMKPVDWSADGPPPAAKFEKKTDLFGKEYNLNALAQGLFDPANKDWAELSNTTNIRLMQTGDHYVLGIKGISGDVDYRTTDLLISRELRNVDQACLSRAILFARKHKELIEQGYEPKVASVDAARFAADQSNVDRYIRELQDHALDNQALRTSYNPSAVKDRPDLVGGGNSKKNQDKERKATDGLKKTKRVEFNKSAKDLKVKETDLAHRESWDNIRSTVEEGTESKIMEMISRLYDLGDDHRTRFNPKQLETIASNKELCQTIVEEAMSGKVNTDITQALTLPLPSSTERPNFSDQQQKQLMKLLNSALPNLRPGHPSTNRSIGLSTDPRAKNGEITPRSMESLHIHPGKVSRCGTGFLASTPDIHKSSIVRPGSAGNYGMAPTNNPNRLAENLGLTSHLPANRVSPEERLKMITKNEGSSHKGTSSSSFILIEGISSSFYEYTMEGIGDILGLRLRAEASISGFSNTLILPGTYIFGEKHSNIHALLFYLNLYFINIILQRNKYSMNRVIHPVILVPISLHGKHAVGVMFVAQEDGSGYKAFYLDPENTTIPEGLAAIFKDNGYQIEQLPTEGQRYTNCGPEVIENFMLYLTGERLSQEDAIVNNSRLIEQELLSSSHDAEEAICLTLKDSYSKEKAVTVISNTTDNTQVTSDGYIIGNPTRYDIVTPQTIIDGLIVRADLGREPHDVLLQLVHDYRINQDYAEAILGEVTSIDIS